MIGREFLGREWLYQVQCGERRLRLRLPLEQDYARGQRCRLRLRAGELVRLFPAGVELCAAVPTERSALPEIFVAPQVAQHLWALRPHKQIGGPLQAQSCWAGWVAPAPVGPGWWLAAR